MLHCKRQATQEKNCNSSEMFLLIVHNMPHRSSIEHQNTSYAGSVAIKHLHSLSQFHFVAAQIPNEQQVAELSGELRSRASLPAHVTKMLQSLPPGTHPMTQFSMAVLALQVRRVWLLVGNPILLGGCQDHLVPESPPGVSCCHRAFIVETDRNAGNPSEGGIAKRPYSQPATVV